MVKTQGSSQSCCSNSDAGGYTRTARESMTETICSSCHATINPVVGVSKGSSSGITPSFGKGTPWHKFQTIHQTVITLSAAEL